MDGQRNVFQALDSISPFAFAFGPRNWSPIISDIKIMPGGKYDVEQILQYDTQIDRLVTVGTLLKVKPYSEFFATLAYFRLNDNPVEADLPPVPPPGFVPFTQPLSNQIRALMGYGNLTRRDSISPPDQLRFHQPDLAEPARPSQLQRKLLRPRPRISPHQPRPGPHRKPLHRHLHHRQHRLLRKSPPPGKHLLAAGSTHFSSCPFPRASEIDGPQLLLKQ